MTSIHHDPDTSKLTIELGEVPSPIPLSVVVAYTNSLKAHLHAAEDYRDADGFNPAEVLGLKGQFAEIWRKVWKLKNALWDGRELRREGPEEILSDLMAHCALAIAMLRRDNSVSATIRARMAGVTHEEYQRLQDRSVDD